MRCCDKCDHEYHPEHRPFPAHFVHACSGCQSSPAACRSARARGYDACCPECDHSRAPSDPPATDERKGLAASPLADHLTDRSQTPFCTGEAHNNSGPIFSSLDDIETNVDAPRASTASQRFFFRGCIDERTLALAALRVARADPATIAIADSCCEHAMVQRHMKTGQLRVLTRTCRNRICPHCARLRREHYTTELVKAIGEVLPNTWRMITLTLRSSDAPLADQLSHLAASYRRLRQQTIWHRSVDRAKATFEITWNEERSQWHPHLHILAEGRFIDQKRLSDAWLKASDGSSIVDIRVMKTGIGAARYVCKYLGKAPDLSRASEPVARMAEYYLATRGRKLIIHSGRWPEVPEAPDLPEDGDDADAWTNLGLLNQLYEAARQGDVAARAIIKLLADLAPPARPSPQDDG